MNPGDRPITVQEVGLRDGLQSLARTMPTERKCAWIDAEYAVGVRHMEVASFVPARLLPQMADAAEVVAHALSHPDLVVTALAPNLKGAEHALAAGVHRITVPVSVSQAHSLANVRKTPREACEQFAAIRRLCEQSPRPGGTRLIAGLSTVFGCTMQGDVPVDDVADVVRRVLDAGCDAVALADTTGMATPGQVDAVFARIRPLAGGVPLIGHFHDTRGMALANTLVALRHGVVEFDASLGGLGGCPFAPGAPGNLATEALVGFLHERGHETGIDLEAVREAGAWMRGLVGR